MRSAIWLRSVFWIESLPEGDEVPSPISPGAMTLSPTVRIPPLVSVVLPFTLKDPEMVVVETVSPPFASK